MDSIQFNEPEYGRTPRRQTLGAPSGLAGWLIRKGYAKDQQRAQYLLLGIAIVATILAVLTLLLSSYHGSAAPTPAQQARFQQTEAALRSEGLTP